MIRMLAQRINALLKAVCTYLFIIYFILLSSFLMLCLVSLPRIATIPTRVQRYYFLSFLFIIWHVLTDIRTRVIRIKDVFILPSNVMMVIYALEMCAILVRDAFTPILFVMITILALPILVTRLKVVSLLPSLLVLVVKFATITMLALLVYLYYFFFLIMPFVY